MTIFVGPDQKLSGIRFHQIFQADLPVAKGTFPQNVKDAVKANPGLENSFMPFHVFSAQKQPATPPINLAPPIARQGTPIRKLAGFTRQ